MVQGLVDPRVGLMGIVHGLSMTLSGVANLFSAEQWAADPLGNLLKSAADVAMGITIILGSITLLATAIGIILTAIAILGSIFSFGAVGAALAPIIAFCWTVVTTVGGWTIVSAKIALVLQALVFVKNLIDAAVATSARDLQIQSEQMTEDATNAGSAAAMIAMAKVGEMGARTSLGQRFVSGTNSFLGARGIPSPFPPTPVRQIAPPGEGAPPVAGEAAPAPRTAEPAAPRPTEPVAPAPAEPAATPRPAEPAPAPEPVAPRPVEPTTPTETAAPRPTEPAAPGPAEPAATPRPAEPAPGPEPAAPRSVEPTAPAETAAPRPTEPAALAPAEPPTAPRPAEPAPAPEPAPRAEASEPAPRAEAPEPATTTAPEPSAPRPTIRSRIGNKRVTEALPEGQTRTPAENSQARKFYSNHRDKAIRWWEERTGQSWPTDPATGRQARCEHPRPLADGGDPLYVEPGFGDPNAPHMAQGDPNRWGARRTPSSAPPQRVTDPRITQALPEGQIRTPAETRQARQYYRNHRSEAIQRWEQRTGQSWPTEPSTGRPARCEHPRPLGDGGDPLHVEPGFGDPVSPHMAQGDPRRWGGRRGPPSED